jgi:hypothetical protein
VHFILIVELSKNGGTVGGEEIFELFEFVVQCGTVGLFGFVV